MATYTPFLNLEKPTTSERLDVLKINSNWDKIDEGVSSLNSKIAYTALTVTKERGASAIAINARQFGRMCVVSGTIDFASAPTAWTNYDIASITSGNTAITSTIYVTALVFGNSGKIATIEINAGQNKLVFRPLGNTNYTDVNGRFFLVYPTE